MGNKYTEAQRDASKRYLSEKVEDIRIRVPKGEKDKIKQFAETKNKSLNQFVVDAINYSMQHDIYSE